MICELSSSGADEGVSLVHEVRSQAHGLLIMANFYIQNEAVELRRIFHKNVISMELEQRYVITFLRDCGKDGAEINSILMEHYGKDSNRKTDVYYWIKEVKRGRTDLTDKALG
jgi:hypothetical protein